MSDEHLTVANRMAGALNRQQVDPNEVSSCLATLRQPGMNGPRFFQFLGATVKNQDVVKRSGRTPQFYLAIEDACQTYLTPYRDDVETMAHILGWTVRLMRYYRVADKLERPPSGAGPRQAPVSVGRPAGVQSGAKTGRVKFFREDRGYGFIRGDDGVDIFVHKSAIVGASTLRLGQKVSYDVGQGRKGPAAKNVQPHDG